MRRTAVTLAVFGVLALAGTALAGTFVTNPSSTLVDTKIDAKPCPYTDPNKCNRSADFNAQSDAILDLRSWVYDPWLATSTAMCFDGQSCTAEFEYDGTWMQLTKPLAVTATGTPTVRSPADRFADIANVKDFGAVGDGVTDDSTAIQAAIDWVLGGTTTMAISSRRNPKAALFLPKGQYLVTKPIRIWSAFGLLVYGEGYQATAILGATPNMQVVLDLNGTMFSTFRDFSIGTTGSGSTTYLMWAHWDQTTSATSCSDNSFDNLYGWGTFVYGFQYGTMGQANQEDQSYWHHCKVLGSWTTSIGSSGNWQAGFRFGTGVFGNNLIHTIHGIAAAHLNHGIEIDATQVAIYGGIIQSNGVDIAIGGATGYIYVNGIRSEASQRFITGGGPGGTNTTWSFTDVMWSCDSMASDRQVVEINWAGTVYFRNVELYCTGGIGVPIITFGQGTLPSTFIADGLSVQAATTPSQTLSQALNLSGTSTGILRGFYAIQGGAVMASWPGQTMIAPSTGGQVFSMVPALNVGGAADDGSAVNYLLAQLSTAGLINNVSVPHAASQPPWITQDANAVFHVYWDGVKIQDKVGLESWTMHGSVPMVTTTPRGSGPYPNTPSYYGGSSVTTTGDFECTAVFSTTPTGANYQPVVGTDIANTSGWALYTDNTGANIRAAFYLPTQTYATAPLIQGGMNVVSWGKAGSTGYLQANRTTGTSVSITGYVPPTTPPSVGWVNGQGSAANIIIDEVYCTTTAASSANLSALNTATLSAYGL